MVIAFYDASVERRQKNVHTIRIGVVDASMECSIRPYIKSSQYTREERDDNAHKRKPKACVMCSIECRINFT